MTAQLGLAQRQAVASSAAIAQEAMFLVDGLSSTGDSGARLSSTAGCLRLLSAQATRDALKQNEMYTSVLTALADSIPRTASHPTAASAAPAHAAQLLAAYALLAHASALTAAPCQAGASTPPAHAPAARALARLVAQKCYGPVSAPRECADALAAARRECQAAQRLPQDFLASPVAVALVAARLLLQAPLLTAPVATAAGPAKLLAQLAATLAANVAVLTGRAPKSFTSRTNACMWYASTALCCLERATAGHAGNSAAAAALRVPFGGRAATVPRVALCVLSFARSAVLLQSAAVHSAVRTALQVLMNLSHAAAGGAALVAAGVPEALATLLLQASDHDSAPASGKLPETQDLLDDMLDVPSGRGDRGVTADAVRRHAPLIKGALCTLVNLAEHSAATASALAALRLRADGAAFETAAAVAAQDGRRASAQNGAAAPEPTGGCARHGTGEAAGTPADAGNVGVLSSQVGEKARLPPPRRRRGRPPRPPLRGGAAPAAELEVITSGCCSLAAPVITTCSAGAATTQDAKRAESAPLEAEGTFLTFLVASLQGLWAHDDALRGCGSHDSCSDDEAQRDHTSATAEPLSASSAAAAPHVAPDEPEWLADACDGTAQEPLLPAARAKRNREPDSCAEAPEATQRNGTQRHAQHACDPEHDSSEGQHACGDSPKRECEGQHRQDVQHTRFYAAALIGLLAHGCPAARAAAAARLSLRRVARDVERGLAVYVTFSALDAGAQAHMERVVAALRAQDPV